MILKKIFVTAVAIAAIAPWASARKVIVAADSVALIPDKESVTDLVITGNIPQALKLGPKEGFTSLTSLTYDGDVDIVGGHTFEAWTKLETVKFNGMVGHSDGYCFFDCPELRSVTFAGPVLTTGGALYMSNCPKAESVTFEGLTVSTGFGENDNCPAFKGYVVKGLVLNASSIDHSSEEEVRARRDEMMPQFEKISAYMQRILASDNEWLFKLAKRYRDVLAGLAEFWGRPEMADLWVEKGPLADSDRMLSKLDLLRKSPAYSNVIDSTLCFTYAQPTDSALIATRERFNLDSVAGDGDELSRIKNLLHFVHESVRHDGSSQWPDVPLNFGALYDVCHEQNRGINCRLMAIMLNEALLAEGIPARYLTCLPKYYDTDNDCHVINIAWSRDLGKWVWIDPTFDAWVTDENGLMLHPGEVRRRLIDGKPLAIPETANWNHKNKQTVEEYINRYMAKNLYIIGCNTVNRAEPEGYHFTTSGDRGRHVYLSPEGVQYGNSDSNTGDEAGFWAAPEL